MPAPVGPFPGCSRRVGWRWSGIALRDHLRGACLPTFSPRRDFSPCFWIWICLPICQTMLQKFLITSPDLDANIPEEQEEPEPDVRHWSLG
jgi:hypothetical protein